MSWVRSVRGLQLQRDRLMLLLVMGGHAGLALETWLSHQESGTIVRAEWTPIVFGGLATVLLAVAGLLAIRRAPLARSIAIPTLVVSIGVGLLGSWHHLQRAALWEAPAGHRLSIDLLVWAPPVLGPLTFCLFGLLGLSAAFPEEPAGSGRLRLPGGLRLVMPFDKTRAYYMITGVGIAAALISAALDHARSNYESMAVWIAAAVGVFGMVVALAMGILERPTRLDRSCYIAAMLILVVSGPLGSWFHIEHDLTAARQLVGERLIRGAPPLAPLLYTTMGLLGLLVLVPDGADVAAE